MERSCLLDYLWSAIGFFKYIFHNLNIKTETVRSALGDGYSTLRRPRSSSTNVHQQPQHGQVPGGSSWLMDPSSSSDHHQHHHQDSNGVCHLIGRDGMPRKCTCGQKMRIQQHPSAASMSSSAGSDRDSHIRSEDGLAGIATIRRPVKRKTRNQIPSMYTNDISYQTYLIPPCIYRIWKKVYRGGRRLSSS